MIDGLETDGKANTLAVVLHGWLGGRKTMKGIVAATKEAYASAGGVDVYVPNLAYRRRLSFTRVTTILIDLMATIDAIIRERGEYERIVLIGHSMGGVLGRRLFLLAAGNPPGFRCEEAFARQEAAARPWAARVERHVTLGAFNRGWQASQRDGWYYSLFYNAIGLTGHLTPTSKWRPTIFDLRLGAPFMVQTRLHWLAYRRREQELRAARISDGQTALPASRDLLVVQILGNTDDLTSPLNQVDLALDRPDYSAAPGDQHYMYLEMKKSTHAQTIVFDGSREGEDRREVFMAALTKGPAYLLAIDIARDPTLLVDDLPRIDCDVTDGVFVMHGIRDDGYWTSRIAKRVKERAPHGRVLKTRTPTYGYFAMLPFLLPWVRRQKVEWFMDQYVEARAQFPKAELSFIGHSNGTYLAASALQDYADAQFKHIFFAGSVVKRSYRWLPLVATERVGKFHNVRAARDWVVALLPKSVAWLPLDLGGAGWDGFADAGKHPAITQAKKFADGGHSAALVESQWDNIVDFIVGGKVPDETEDFVCARPWWLWVPAATHLGVLVIAAVALLAIPLKIACPLLPTFAAHWLKCSPSDLTVLQAVGHTLGLAIYFALLKFIVTRV